MGLKCQTLRKMDKRIVITLFIWINVVTSDFVNMKPYTPCGDSDSCLVAIPCNITTTENPNEFYQEEYCRFNYFMDALKELDCVLDTIQGNDTAKLRFRETLYVAKVLEEQNCKKDTNIVNLVQCLDCWKSLYKKHTEIVTKEIKSHIPELTEKQLEECEDVHYFQTPEFVLNCQRFLS